MNLQEIIVQSVRIGLRWSKIINLEITWWEEWSFELNVIKVIWSPQVQHIVDNNTAEFCINQMVINYMYSCIYIYVISTLVYIQLY
jgi:hypothetical protein